METKSGIDRFTYKQNIYAGSTILAPFTISLWSIDLLWNAYYWRSYSSHARMARTTARAMVLLAMLVGTLPVATALGVTSPFWESNPLTMYPGEAKEFDLVLQNMVGNRDFSVKGTIEEGAEFATLVDKNTVYSLPFGNDDLKVRVRVSIPPDVQTLEQKIGISFTEIVKPETGNMVQVGGAVKTYIPLIISPRERASGASTGNLSLMLSTTLGKVSLTLIALLVIAVLIYLFARKKRTKKR